MHAYYYTRVLFVMGVHGQTRKLSGIDQKQSFTEFCPEFMETATCRQIFHHVTSQYINMYEAD